MLSIYFQSSLGGCIYYRPIILFEGTDFKKLSDLPKTTSCEQQSWDFNLSTSNSLYDY